MQSIDNVRLSLGAASVGYAKRMLDAGLKYAMERKAFGEPIANFQLIQAMLADSKAEIYAADCMLNDACARADRGETILVEAENGRASCREKCVSTCRSRWSPYHKKKKKMIIPYVKSTSNKN